MKKNKLLFSSMLTLFLFFGIWGSAWGQTLYSEDFTGQDGKGATGPGGSSPSIDLTDVDWTVNTDSVDLSATSDFFRVESGVFTGQDIDGTQKSNGTGDGAIWISPSIDINGYSNVSISLDVGASTGLEDRDFIKASYSIDGGDTTQFGFEYDDAVSSVGSFSVSNLTGTSLKIFVEMDNNAAAETITFDNVLVEVFSLKGEPTNHASDFTATSTSVEKVDLSWTDASSGTVPDGYLILGNASGSFTAPIDATEQTDDTDLSDGTGILNISQGTQSASFDGLNADTQYYFEIYPYTNSGSEIDYKTDGTVPSDNVSTLEAPDLVLNEILADPAADLPGDANGDGTRDSADDEFLEFVNVGNSDLTISNWTIEAGGTTEYTFTDPTVLSPMQAIVVFGGGTPTGTFGNAIVQTASGVGLNNGGETIEVKDGSGNTLIYYSYGGASDQSETRSPDLTGDFADHTNADTDDASSYSPGTRIDGTTFQPSVKITGSGGWRMLSTPTTGNTYADLLDALWTQGIPTGADVTNGDANVQTFDGSSFAGNSDMGITMTPGSGFITYVFSDDDHDGNPDGFPKTLELFAVPNSGSFSPTLASGADAWTLVGNPYYATIAWDELNPTGLTGVVYVYDHSYGTPVSPDVEATNSAGSYRVWNGDTGSLTDGKIVPFQGFWVQNASSGTPSLTIEEADTTTGGTFYKESGAQLVNIKLKGEMENRQSEAFLSFTEHGLKAKDNFDGLKLTPLDFADYLSVATVTENTQLDINNLPLNFERTLEIPLSMQAFHANSETGTWIIEGGTVKLSWPMMENVPDDWELTLHDYATGTAVDMKVMDSYTFTLKAEKAAKKAMPSTTILRPQPPTVERSLRKEEGPRFTLTVTKGKSSSIDPGNELPEEFKLEQNYPNPFNPTTRIQYSVKESGPVMLTIYNVMGQQVATLIDGAKSAGTYRISWNAAQMASGIYYYRLQAGNEVLTRQMTLIK